MRTARASSVGSIGVSWGLALAGPVTFLRDEFAMPGEDGLRFHDGGHVLEGLLPQLVADFSQSLALTVA